MDFSGSARHALGQMPDPVRQDSGAVFNGIFGDHADCAIGLQSRHDPAAGEVEAGPPPVVIAEIERNTSRIPRMIIGSALAAVMSLTLAGVTAVWIGQLASGSWMTCILTPQTPAENRAQSLLSPLQTKAGSVDGMHCARQSGASGFASKVGLARSAKTPLKDPARASIDWHPTMSNVSPPRHRDAELRSVAPKSAFNLTQASHPTNASNQCNQLAFRRQTADMLVGLVHPQARSKRLKQQVNTPCYCGHRRHARGFLHLICPAKLQSQ